MHRYLENVVFVLRTGNPSETYTVYYQYGIKDSIGKGIFMEQEVIFSVFLNNEFIPQEGRFQFHVRILRI